MEKTQISEGYFKLTAEQGIKDTRTSRVYSEVECKEKDIKFFTEA